MQMLLEGTVTAAYSFSDTTYTKILFQIRFAGLPMLTSDVALRWIRAVHTLVWGVFASSIILIPALTYEGRLTSATWLIAFVALEVVVLVVNGMRCPLTDVAARYTADRQDNFDIYLPLWLARHNKTIFGTLYALGVAYTLLRWAGALG